MSPVTNQKMEEYMSPREGFQSADISAGDIDSTVFHSMAGFREAVAVASCDAVADTETMTLTLLQASDAAGTGKKVLGTAVVATASGAVTLAAIASALLEDMDHANGFTFVGARVTSDAAGVIPGRVNLALTGARYKPVAQTA